MILIGLKPPPKVGVCKLDYVLWHNKQMKGISKDFKEYILDIMNRSPSKSAVCEHTVYNPSHFISILIDNDINPQGYQK